MKKEEEKDKKKKKKELNPCNENKFVTDGKVRRGLGVSADAKILMEGQ